MGFALLSFLNTMLGGLNVPEARVLAWLKDKGAEYPDAQERTDALAAWLTETLAEVGSGLDPATMVNTIKGIAADIIHGTAGVDPDAWQGGG